MIRKAIAFVFLFVFSLNLWTTEGTSKNNKAGFALLDSLVTTFSDMAAKGTGGAEVVNARIQPIMAELKKAKAQKQIDSVFFNRFRRILMIIKLTIIDTSYDPEGILESLIVSELNEFINDVCGMDEQHPSPENRSIGTIAGALSEEILNLYIYLDNQKNREQLRKKYFKWEMPSK
jgi:hypothetical protein